MPAINRATFFFEDSKGRGWSETIHTNKPDLSTAMDAALALKPLRVALLGSSAKMTYIRVSDDTIKRDSLVQVVSEFDGSGPSAAGGAAPAHTALIMRLQADPLSKRTLFLRGFPDACESNSGQFSPTGAFSAALLAWAFKLQADAWACKHRNETNPPHLIVFPVTQDTATGQVTITTQDDHGLTAALKEPITITGAQGCPEINGTWTPAFVTSPTTFKIIINKILRPYTGHGIMRKLGFDLKNITSVVPVRISKRAAGRPLGSLPGRRPAKRRG